MLDEGLELLADVVATAPAYVPGRLVADLKIARGPRLLHGHGLRDRARRARAQRVGVLGRALRLAGQRRQDDLPGRRALDRRDPAARPAARARACCRATRSVPTAVVVAVTSEDQRGGRHRRRGAAAGPGDPDRGRARGGQVRQADPLRRPPRDPVRLVRRRPDGRADEVKDIRSGDQVPADAGDLDAARRGPAPAGRAGATEPGRRSRPPGGAPDVARHRLGRPAGGVDAHVLDGAASRTARQLAVRSRCHARASGSSRWRCSQPGADDVEVDGQPAEQQPAPPSAST